MESNADAVMLDTVRLITVLVNPFLWGEGCFKGGEAGAFGQDYVILGVGYRVKAVAPSFAFMRATILILRNWEGVTGLL